MKDAIEKHKEVVKDFWLRTSFNRNWFSSLGSFETEWEYVRVCLDYLRAHMAPTDFYPKLKKELMRITRRRKEENMIKYVTSKAKECLNNISAGNWREHYSEKSYDGMFFTYWEEHPSVKKLGEVVDLEIEETFNENELLIAFTIQYGQTYEKIKDKQLKELITAARDYAFMKHASGEYLKDLNIRKYGKGLQTDFEVEGQKVFNKHIIPLFKKIAPVDMKGDRIEYTIEQGKMAKAVRECGYIRPHDAQVRMKRWARYKIFGMDRDVFHEVERGGDSAYQYLDFFNLVVKHMK